MSLKIGEKVVNSVKELGFGRDAKSLGVSSESKLFAYGTLVVFGRL